MKFRRGLLTLLLLWFHVTVSGGAQADVPADGSDAALNPIFVWVIVILIGLVILGIVVSRVKAIKNQKELEEIMEEVKDES